MSEEPDVTAPRPEAPAGAEPGSAEPGSPEPGSAGPGSAGPGSAGPAAPPAAPSSGTRRKSLIIGFGAGILVAAVIAAVVLVVARPGGQPLKYTSLPPACDTVSAASLAKYLPDATSSPQSRPSSSADQEGACSWSSITGGQDRDLLVLLDVYGTSSGLTKAQQAYQGDIALSVSSHDATLSRRLVTGLGDQATAQFITVKPGGPGTAAAPPQVILTVRSGNADITLTYAVFPIGSARPALTPAAELAGTIAMARDVLVALANPAAAASAAAAPAASSAGPPASPSPQGPRYVSPRDPCTLVRAATLARYAPGATASKIPVPSGTTVPGAPQLSNCGWATPNASILLELTIDSDSAAARQGYEFGVQYARQNQQGLTFHGAKAVTGVGQQATAIFQVMTGNSPSVALYVWSGNAEFQVSFTDLPFGTQTSRAAKLAAVIAMARDILAALPT